MIPTIHLAKPPERDSALTALLGQLEKEDRLFQYNVPSPIKTSYADDDLLEYLQRVYAQAHFIVEGEQDVRKYAQIGDLVIKVGLYENKEFILPTGATGYVHSEVVGENKRKVSFDKYDPQVIEIEQLEKYGEYRLMIKDKILDAPINGTHIKGGLQVLDLVRYIGEEKVRTVHERVPDKTRGIIVDITNWNIANKNINPQNPEQKYFIRWLNEPGVIQQSTYHPETKSTQPKSFFNEKDFRLVVENHIDFEKIKREIIPPEAQ